MDFKDTKLIHSYKDHSESTFSIKADKLPIYQNACFLYSHHLDEGTYTYSRKANPNRSDLERKLAILDEANYSFALANGTQAIHSILSLLSANSHILISEHLYSGSQLLIDRLAQQYQIEVSSISNEQANDPNIVEEKLKPNSQLLFIESPTNPTQGIVDIKSLSLIAQKNNVLLAVDNSLLSSYLCQPLSLGADIAIQSAAKHLGGHNDLMAGVVSVNNKAIYQKLNRIIQTYGLGLTAFDSWLLSRSLDTLGLRIRQQQKSSLLVLNYLKANKQIDELYYTDSSTVISFSLKQANLTNQWLEHAATFFNISRNFGSIQSSISIPSLMSHQETFNALQSNDDVLPFHVDLIRLSIGIEDSNDILNALTNTFHKTLQKNNNQSLNVLA
ncbi:PLP-dependent aspartate aminotransferase family protein [Thiotrichales bacterium 19S3-7]|nr:PLP-dependent aspartate aminotransferase family protein [Thiotrichales bacterium 19S3-7]MCF6802515.1 PLP-dependent aspartate aminotransferase family protein [Thiotrichales bacterium 19S3-11]